MSGLRWRIAGLGALLLCVGPAARADDIAQFKLQLMRTTQVVVIMVPLENFVPDRDPNTLEIVMMPNPDDGPSRVSDDGEVVYLDASATDEEKSELISKAFDIRARLRLAVHAHP